MVWRIGVVVMSNVGFRFSHTFPILYDTNEHHEITHYEHDCYGAAGTQIQIVSCMKQGDGCILSFDERAFQTDEASMRAFGTLFCISRSKKLFSR